jgi:hypothetical protein
MANRRDDEQRRFRGERRDPETERRIDRRADIYRGSDERGYGGGERLGREWERGDPRAEERFDRDMRVRSVDEDRFDRGGRGGEERFSRSWDEHRIRDANDDWALRSSPSGAFHDENRERPRRYDERARYGGDLDRHGVERGRRGLGTRGFGEGPEHGRDHSHLAGLHDLDDMSELRERYQERRRQRDYQPRYGHGPGVENMERPLSGYGTSTTRSEDHELGHGGFIGGGDTWRSGASRPMGRGPKGYQRSDDRIREDICDRLMTSWMDAENVDVLVREGEVTLQGMVRSREEKRAIEELAESVLGVKDVHNTLRVNRGEQLSSPATAPRGQAQERRAQDQEQTSAQQPDDSTLHS